MNDWQTAERAEGQALFDLMAANMPGTVWSTDADLRFTSSFGAGLSALGLGVNEVVGTTLFEFFHTDDKSFSAIDAHLRALRGESVSYEQVWAGQAYQVHVEPLVNKRTEVVGCMGIAHDITALREAQDRLEERIEERTSELAQANEQLRHEQDILKRLLESHDRERQLIVDEIHDGLAQQLVAALMYLQPSGEQQVQDPDAAAKCLERGVGIVRQCLTTARSLIAGVRPPALDELGVVAAIQNLLYERRCDEGPEVEFRSKVEFERLEPVLENALYRIVQEGFANACHHSEADKVLVELTQCDRFVAVEIRDWGIGFESGEVEDEACGLESIRECARLLRGSAAIDSTLGQGTRVVARLPLSTEG